MKAFYSVRRFCWKHNKASFLSKQCLRAGYSHVYLYLGERFFLCKKSSVILEHFYSVVEYELYVFSLHTLMKSFQLVTYHTPQGVRSVILTLVNNWLFNLEIYKLSKVWEYSLIIGHVCFDKHQSVTWVFRLVPDKLQHYEYSWRKVFLGLLYAFFCWKKMFLSLKGHNSDGQWNTNELILFIA